MLGLKCFEQKADSFFQDSVFFKIPQQALYSKKINRK